MGLTAMWTHGNSLFVETPANLQSINHFGWGTDLFFTPGKDSWLHIPVPTAVIVNGVRAQLFRFFAFFLVKDGDGIITDVHLYDGPFRIQMFGNLALSGDHSQALDGANTFVLPQPHSVAFGIGISIHFQAAIGFDTTFSPMLRITTAGADCNT